jgi:hypothetical protein
MQELCGRGANETPAPCPSTPPHAPKWVNSLGQRHSLVAIRRVLHIHDPITHGIEDPRVEGLREEVSKIINGVDKGNIDALLFDESGMSAESPEQTMSEAGGSL